MKNELSVNDFILRQNRIVFPTCYHRIAVKVRALKKTKALLRTKIYFVNMDNFGDDEIQHCIPFHTVTIEKPPSSINIMSIPELVWQCINVDYLCPWPDSYMFVVIDQNIKIPRIGIFLNHLS